MAAISHRGERAALVALALLGAACSGDDDASPTTTTTAPSDETSTSTTAPEVEGLAASALAAGDQHACALDDAGAAWCWGDNSFGQLGNGASGEGSADHRRRRRPHVHLDRGRHRPHVRRR